MNFYCPTPHKYLSYTYGRKTMKARRKGMRVRRKTMRARRKGMRVRRKGMKARRKAMKARRKTCSIKNTIHYLNYNQLQKQLS